ncbi:polysaccharide deacetylase family protein [uncultured Pontibacter sp.]|uniref:polysaccharide deacetylase family protein n=1 Tax=uncultured Pontibacter sp. TaxID=453356 RepID=UPI00260879FD|nr:polysaccharide deacetylase family protein [uncultured Pontibacter sp.]
MAGDFILSVYFHNPTLKEFEFCIKWLLKHKFQFLSLHDVEQLIIHKKPLPRSSVLITVDDGWALNKEAVVAIANKYKLPVGIFISTEPVEEGVFWWSYLDEARKSAFVSFSKEDLKEVPNKDRINIIDTLKHKIKIPRQALTVEQVKAIAQSPYVTIGGHTLTHPILPNCDYQQVYDELRLSKLKLESWIGKEVKYFAYPNGSYSSREIDMLADTNYTLAFTTEPHYLTAKRLENKYQLPRFEVYQGRTNIENICRMLGVYQPFKNSVLKTIELLTKPLSREKD